MDHGEKESTFCAGCGFSAYAGHANGCTVSEPLKRSKEESDEDVATDVSGTKEKEPSRPFAKEAGHISSLANELLRPNEGVSVFQKVDSEIRKLGTEFERTKQAGTGMYQTLLEGYTAYRAVARQTKEEVRKIGELSHRIEGTVELDDRLLDEVREAAQSLARVWTRLDGLATAMADTLKRINNWQEEALGNRLITPATRESMFFQTKGVYVAMSEMSDRVTNMKKSWMKFASEAVKEQA